MMNMYMQTTAVSDETEIGLLDGSLAQNLNSAEGEEKVSILTIVVQLDIVAGSTRRG